MSGPGYVPAYKNDPRLSHYRGCRGGRGSRVDAITPAGDAVPVREKTVRTPLKVRGRQVWLSAGTYDATGLEHKPWWADRPRVAGQHTVCLGRRRRAVYLSVFTPLAT